MRTDFAGELGLTIAATALHQPTFKALMMHRTDIASATARLYKRLGFIAIIAYPAILFRQERLSLLRR